jgi:hypothetical protein
MTLRQPRFYWSTSQLLPLIRLSMARHTNTSTRASWTADVFPVFPSAGGTAPDAQTDTWTMLVDGVPAITIS